MNSKWAIFGLGHSCILWVICVYCGSENKQRLFPYTTLTDWFVFITETSCVYCAVRTEFVNKIGDNLSL